MFKAQIFVIYCNPRDPKTAEKVLEAAIKAKNQYPVKLVPSSDGEFEINKDKDILFVISTASNLMFYQFNEEIEGPQALLMPFGDTFNAMEVMLPKLKMFDDVPLKEWIQKAANSEQIFAPKPEDSKNEIDKKDSLKRWYSMQRFELEKKFYTKDINILTDGSKMSQYIGDIRKGKVPLYFESAIMPPE